MQWANPELSKVQMVGVLHRDNLPSSSRLFAFFIQRLCGLEDIGSDLEDSMKLVVDLIDPINVCVDQISSSETFRVESCCYFIERNIEDRGNSRTLYFSTRSFSLLTLIVITLTRLEHISQVSHSHLRTDVVKYVGEIWSKSQGTHRASKAVSKLSIMRFLADV